MPSNDLIARFTRERNAALLSLDAGRIRAMYRKWGGADLPDDPVVFWGSVHKAITACKGLPIEFRRKSKAWLDARGWESFDDGELSTEAPDDA